MNLIALYQIETTKHEFDRKKLTTGNKRVATILMFLMSRFHDNQNILIKTGYVVGTEKNDLLSRLVYGCTKITDIFSLGMMLGLSYEDTTSYRSLSVGVGRRNRLSTGATYPSSMYILAWRIDFWVSFLQQGQLPYLEDNLVQ
ncbi:hypothetical protein ACJX0J_040086 [Zea mays]